MSKLKSNSPNRGKPIRQQANTRIRIGAFEGKNNHAPPKQLSFVNLLDDECVDMRDYNTSQQRIMTQETLQSLEPGTLTRNPIPKEIVDEVFPIDDTDKEMLRGLVHDHEEEARIECTYEFLEQYLLPRMRLETVLTQEELASRAVVFKMQFRQQHPKDLVREFQLIPSVDLTLFKLQLFYGATQESDQHKNEVAFLLYRAFQALNELIRKNQHDLYAV